MIKAFDALERAVFISHLTPILNIAGLAIGLYLTTCIYARLAQ